MNRFADHIRIEEDWKKAGWMSRLKQKKLRASSLFLFAAIVAPPFFFYSIVYKYAVNIPYWDDYAAILEFLLRYQDADGALPRLKILFAQHNEHRIAFGNLATVIIYKLIGGVDFRALIFFGNAALLGLVLAFYRMFQQMKTKAFFFIPVVLFLFQFQFCDNIMWAMASVSNYYVLTFSFASLLLLQRDGRLFFIGAFFLAALSSVTQGSGILTFVAGALLITLKRDLRGLAAWSVLSVTVLALYFGNYEKPPDHPSITDAILKEPIHALHYFFTFIGASFPFPFFAGLLFAVLFIFLTLKRYYRKNPAVYCGIVYVFLIAAVAALTRSGFGVEQALSSRYRIVSALFPILMYMAFSDHLRCWKLWERLFLPAILTGSLIFNINANITGLKNIRKINTLFRDSVTMWTLGAQSLLYHDKEKANRILIESINRGLYRPNLH